MDGSDSLGYRGHILYALLLSTKSPKTSNTSWTLASQHLHAVHLGLLACFALGKGPAR